MIGKRCRLPPPPKHVARRENLHDVQECGANFPRAAYKKCIELGAQYSNLTRLFAPLGVAELELYQEEP